MFGALNEYVVRLVTSEKTSNTLMRGAEGFNIEFHAGCINMA